MSEKTMIDVTRYTYRVTWSVEDDQYVATCVELPSMSWLADTQEDALRGMRDLVAEVVRDLTDTGEPVPDPLSSRSYSGKFNLRVGEQLHHRSRRRTPQPQPNVVRRPTIFGEKIVCRIRCHRGPTRASSTSASANSSTAGSPWKPPKNTSASTNTSSADSATHPELRADAHLRTGRTTSGG